MLEQQIIMWEQLAEAGHAYVEGAAECMESVDMMKDAIEMAELTDKAFANVEALKAQRT